MNLSNFIGGSNKQIVGKLKETFGKITDNDWKKIEGNFESLAGAIQKAYSVTLEEAEEMLIKCIGKNNVKKLEHSFEIYVSQTRELIKEHPMTSLLAAFVLGVFLGRK